MTPEERVEAAAARIAQARSSHEPLAALDPELRPGDVAAGYRVQDRVHALLAPRCGALVGHKIGCTSQVMQDYLGIAHPCSGGIFAEVMHPSGRALPFDAYVRVGVECEIAVRLGRDLPGDAVTRERAAAAVAAVFPAIEIVDDRYVRWQELGAPTLIADDFFAAGIVLGPAASATGLDPAAIRGRALVNGREIGAGIGTDLLGHPFDALAWLAASLAERATPLRAGQTVMLGSMVQTVWLERGDVVRMEFSDLGPVEATFQ